MKVIIRKKPGRKPIGKKAMTRKEKNALGYSSWKTSSEVNFIIGLGTFNKHQRLSKKELLVKYIEAAAVRDDWGWIDEEQVVEFAQAVHDSI